MKTSTDQIANQGHLPKSNKYERAGSKSDRALRLANRNTVYFKDSNGRPFARVPIGTHMAVIEINSPAFRDWLLKRWFKTDRSALPERAFREVIATLAAQARFGDATHMVHMRAASRPGCYYLDLSDDGSRAARVEPGKHTVVKNPGVFFLRTPSMQDVPRPKLDARPEAIQEYLRLLNIPKGMRLLVITWLIECLRPDTPYVGLGLFGQQGTAKSTATWALQALIDPSNRSQRVASASTEDMFVAAANSHLVTYENLSRVNDAAQDAMCAMLTGGTFTSRKLHTNLEESAVNIKRPICINAIEQVVTRPDLVDRFVCVEMPEIANDRRRSEAELRGQLKAKRPQALGALLKIFAAALKELPNVKADKLELPRMADFALLGEAIARVLGEKPGSFLKLYNRMRQRHVLDSIDATCFGAALLSFLQIKGRPFNGSYEELSTSVRAHRVAHGGGTDHWPITSKAVGAALRRLQPAMKQVGYQVSLGQRNKRGYLCKITASEQP